MKDLNGTQTSKNLNHDQKIQECNNADDLKTNGQNGHQVVKYGNGNVSNDNGHSSNGFKFCDHTKPKNPDFGKLMCTCTTKSINGKSLTSIFNSSIMPLINQLKRTFIRCQNDCGKHLRIFFKKKQTCEIVKKSVTRFLNIL
jgi:hypothetical protein